MPDRKKHITMIVDSYLPLPTAVGICAEKIVNELKSDNNISVICIKNSSQQVDKENIDGYKIYRTSTKYRNEYHSLTRKDGTANKLLLMIYRITNSIKTSLNKETIDRYLVDSINDQLIEVNAIEKIDTIIPLCFPFESIISAINFKKEMKSNALILPYIFDNFSNSASLHRNNFIRMIKMRRNLQLERKSLSEANHIIAMHPLRNHFESNNIIDSNDVTYLEHPLLTKNNNPDESQKNTCTKLNYSGGVFNKVRDPSYPLEILKRVSLKTNIFIDFFIFGSAYKKVQCFCEENKNISKCHDQITNKMIIKEYSKANVLINMGEIEGKQISSKVFEYISLGKPIIHFSYIENCIVSEILEKYPLALTILHKNNYEESSNSIIEFIEKTKEKNIDFEEIKNIYPEAIPKITADIFKNIIKESSPQNYI